MSRYELMLVFEKFGGCPWYTIPIRSGLLYDELKCILDDFSWMVKEGDTVDHFLQSSVLEGKPSRVLAGRGEKIDGSSRKELDEEVVVVWTKEGKPINHSVFNVRPFFVIYGDWKVPQRLLVYQEPSLYLWVIYLLLQTPQAECWTSRNYFAEDERCCMVVQEGTSVKQMKLMVHLRTECSVDSIDWLDEKKNMVPCLESSMLMLTGEGRWSCEAMKERVLVRKQCYTLGCRYRTSKMLLGVFSIGDMAHQQKLYRSRERDNGALQWFLNMDKCESSEDEGISCEER